MRLKAFRILSSIAIVLIFLGACSAKMESGENKKDVLDVGTTKEKKLVESLSNDFYTYEGSTFAIIDKTVIYMEPKDQKRLIVRYDFEEKRRIVIGEIENYRTANLQGALINGNIYFYASVNSENDYGFTVNLYEINLAENVLVCLREEKLAQTIIPVAKADNKLISLKSSYAENDNFLITYIELYEPENKKRNICLEQACKINEDGSLSGSLIEGIAYKDKSIWIIRRDNEREQTKCFFEEYDLSGNLLQTISAEPLEKILENSTVLELEWQGEYFYIQNFSKQAAFFCIKDGSIDIKYLSEEPISIAQNKLRSSNIKREKEILFKNIGPKEVMVLDTKNWSVTKKQLAIYDDSIILGVITMDEKGNVILAFVPAEKDQRGLFFQGYYLSQRNFADLLE